MVVAGRTGSREIRGTSAPRPRTPGTVYAALSLVLLAFVGALALTSRQSPPPTIAEFAPRAVEQISDASQDPASAAGELSGTSGAAGNEPGESTAQAAIEVARVRRCVGEPPRQVEDPQSPPCVPYWSGDNGGATSRGVTRDEIRVVDFLYAPALSPFLEAFFNRRFEFYGRRIRLIPRVFQGGPEGEKATARAVYEQDRAFASTAPGGQVYDYFDELARYGIVGVHFHSVVPETHLAANRPYLWMYPMANDRQFAMVGSWYCARFAGRKAVHAGDPLLQTSRRKAGIILTEAGPEGTSAEPMNEQLASCRERTDAVIESTVQPYDLAHYAAFMENSMLQMKTSGVTSVACLCDVFLLGFAMRAATNQGYFPEWLLTSFESNESSGLIRMYAGVPEQLRNTMLLLPHPMERPFSDRPSNWAVQETSKAEPPRTASDQYILDFRYWMLLVVASGLQMAGPHLTPGSFERGLHQTTFPNADHPIMAGAVGFRDGDHTMTDDAVEVWWSNTTRSPYEDGLGAFCYVDGGARRRMGTFGSDDPFFSGPCDRGA